MARSTVARALRVLEAEGLIRIVPRWGTFRGRAVRTIVIIVIAVTAAAVAALVLVFVISTQQDKLGQQAGLHTCGPFGCPAAALASWSGQASARHPPDLCREPGGLVWPPSELTGATLTVRPVRVLHRERR